MSSTDGHPANFSEDFEREAQKDCIYLLEHKMRIEAEWQQWEEEQEKLKHKLPAKITVVTEQEEKSKKDEIQPDALPF
jgi:hypothetical protein